MISLEIDQEALGFAMKYTLKLQKRLGSTVLPVDIGISPKRTDIQPHFSHVDLI